jgi:hypothetical protein
MKVKFEIKTEPALRALVVIAIVISCITYHLQGARSEQQKERVVRAVVSTTSEELQYMI